MLVANYRNGLQDIAIADLQFAIAIAIDLMGDSLTANKVLTLFCESDPYPAEDLRHKRNIFYKSLIEKYGNNIIAGMIKELFNEPLIIVRADSLYKKEKKVSLRDLNFEYSPEQLYSKVMQLLCTYETEYLIYVYSKTNMFYKFFRTKFLHADAKGSEDLLNRLLNAFQDDVLSRSVNGSYQTTTCTPHIFLYNAYTMYFKKEGIFHEISNSINTLGTLSSDDKRTVLDKYVDDGIDNYADKSSFYTTEGIKFPEIATRIYKASISMFNHRDSLVAYDDIFSWYRETIIGNIEKTNKGMLDKLKSFFKLVILKSKDSLPIDSTQRLKQAVRYTACEVYSVLLESGLDKTEIYPFFEHVKAASNAKAQTDRDGKMMWTTGNNSEKFKVQYEGFIALKEFIDYLNSPANTTGITVMNFPASIFRDIRIIRRFSTMEEYLLLYESVAQLMRNDSEIDSSNDIGLYNNDAIYKKLLTTVNKTNNVALLLSKAGNIDISKMAYINTSSSFDIFESCVTNKLSENWTSHASKGEMLLNEQIPAVVLKALNSAEEDNQRIAGACFFLFKLFVKFKQDNEKSTRKCINYGLAMINIIDCLFSTTGNVIAPNGLTKIETRKTVDGYVEGTEELCYQLESLGVPKEVTWESVNGSETKFPVGGDFIRQIFELAIEQLGFDKNNYSLIAVFNLARIANSLISQITFCQKAVLEEVSYAKKNYKGDLFLTFAKIVYKYPILNLKLPIKNLYEIAPYYDCSYITKEFDVDDRYVRFQISSEKEQTNKVLLKGINYILSEYEKVINLFSEFNHYADNELIVVGTSKTLSPEDKQVLKKLHTKIVMTKVKSPVASQLNAIMNENNVCRDEFGYIIRYNQPLTIRHNNIPYYVHYYGYKVTPNMITGVSNGDIGVSDIAPLTEEDVMNIRYLLGVYNG